MQITRHTDYALRVLIYLAAGEGKPATISEITDYYGISRNHLTKVVQKLHRLGHIVASRGRGGGLTLARPPQDINVGAVFRDMENELRIVECMRPGGVCRLDGQCDLKKLLGNATAAFLNALDQQTLADITPGTLPARDTTIIDLTQE